jgi:type VI protein secretion system component Hcp/Ca2+-binding RTX toxin-like protein
MSTRYFLALNGVKGDSLNSTYKGWFEVSGFDFDLANSANIGSASGGAGAGKLTFSPLTLTLDSNTGLAPLLAMAATGATLNGATLVGVNDAGQQVYHLDLADVLVTNVEHHAEVFPEAGPTLTLGYGQIELETFTPDGTGGVVPEGHFGSTLPSADPGGSVAATPEGRAMDYFMLIDGLNGGSLNPQHEGWFEITGVDLDMEKLAAGDFASLNVTVPAGVELADVMRMAATGGDVTGHGVIRGVHIEGFTAGRNATKVYDLTLKDVTVSHVGVSNAAGSESLDYNLSLDYGKIALVTNGIDGSGKPVKNGEFAYDVTNHTEIAPFSLGLTLGTESAFASASRYLLKLDGVAGELDFDGESWFEVNSFSFDIEGAGRDAGKATFSPLTLTLDNNTALAPLLTMAATGQHFETGTLVGMRADGEPITYRLDLRAVFVTKVEDIAGAGLTVNLDFGAIKLQPFTQDKIGVVRQASSDFRWNVATNTDDFDDISGAEVSTAASMPSMAGNNMSVTSIAGDPLSPEPATYFMLIDGLNGGSTDPLHQGWFEITGLDFDLENPSISIGSATGGAGTGKPNFSLLNVALPQESGLADVMALVATGTLVKGVRIEGFTGGTTPAKVYELSLGDVVATKVVDGEGGGYGLSLDYGAIELVTKDQSGTPNTTNQFFYNVVTNSDSGVHPSSLALSPAGSGGPVTPAKYFLALDGVKGDSIDANHKGWFEISGFDFDLGNTSSIGSATGGAGAGRPTFSPLTLSLNSNTALAPLLELAATGAHLNGATLVGVTAAGEQAYRLDLADVRATKVEDDAGAGLTLSLGYGKIELETFTHAGPGVVRPAGQFGFDVAANEDGVVLPSTLPSGSVAASPQPASYFMLIDGVNGGSTDPLHRGWFEITGVDLDLAPATVPGGGTGTAAFAPLNVTLPHETRLADVMALLATGELVTGVRIEGVTGGTTPAKVYDLTLADVAVTKVADGEDDGYSLSLDYGKIALATNGIDATGHPTTNGEFGFDVVNNTEIDPFTLALNPGHDPVANAQSIGADEDTATAVTLSGLDVDGDSLIFSVLSGPAHGTLSGSGANLIYTPDADQNGPDSFTYVANDGWTDSTAASVSLTVQAVNDAPVANVQSIGTDEDTAKAVTLSGSDADGDSLTFRVVSGPAHGTLSGSGANLTYTPAANYNGPDSFTYVANDGAIDSAAASVSLTVQAVNDAPAFTSPATFAVAENNTTIGTAAATDIEGNPVTFAIAGGADQALFAIDPGGALRFVAAADFETPQDANRDNVYDLVVSATDSLGAVSTQTLAIDVSNVAEQGSMAFRIALDGTQQVPAVVSGATGLGTAIFDGATSSMSITINVQGLDWGPLVGQASQTQGLLDNINGADIRNAPRGVNGSIVLDWAGHGDADDFAVSAVLADGSRTLTSNWETTDANPITPFILTLAGATLGSDVPLYVNLHTGAFPGGEIRGQLVTIATDTGETVNGTAGSDFLPGLGGHDTIFGLAGNDTLDGGIGNDMLDGGTGNDVMAGGLGDDGYVVDSTLDTVTEKADEGTDTVTASIHYALTAEVENLVLSGSADLQGYGNGLANTITGDTGNNLLNGLGGADAMSGGLGSDAYFVDNAGDAVTENANAGNDTVYASIDYTLAPDVEYLVLQGNANLSGSGNSLSNSISGNAGNNILNGGADIDSMYGGAGNDRYFVDNAGDVVVENSGEGIDSVIASAHYALTANVENLTLQGDAATALQGYGNELANILTGSDGVNLLNGRGGADIMVGGLGNDVYYVDDPGDRVIENPGEGTDAIFSTVSRVLETNVETLVLQGTGNLFGEGNLFANKLYGNDGNNMLNGQSGNDMLNGGAGRDTLIGGVGNDTFVFVAGQADGDIVADFDNGGPFATADTLKFVGYGVGATFTQNDAAHWQVNFNGGASHEVITFTNSALINASDVLFS